MVGTWLLIGLASLSPSEPQELWSIGKPDGSSAEFALAPSGYASYREDGLFVVGRSDVRKDWPYVHPGPQDGWAGGRAHTFRVIFALQQAPSEGSCALRLDFQDTHHQGPPVLTFAVNGRKIADRALSKGAGDASVMGDAHAGKRSSCIVRFPAAALHQGANEITIANGFGSWALYDCFSLRAPAGVKLEPSLETVAVFEPAAVPSLQRDGGRLKQSVTVRLYRFGEPISAEISVDGQVVSRPRLNTGRNEFDLLIPAVEKARSVALSASVGGKLVASQSVPVEPVRKWVIYLLPHSHVDIGYTQVQTDVEKRQWSHLETALALARKTANYPEGSRFKWNSEVLWAVDGYLRHATPEKRAALLEAVHGGSIELQALYGNELTGLCRPEEMFRLVDLAVRLRKEQGIAIDSAMISDVPGWTWGVVPALAQSGVRYFSCGPNPGDRIGGTLRHWGDKPFWWIGPSGQDKVLCWVAGRGYASFHGVSLKGASESWIAEYLRELQAAKYPYDMVQVRYTTGGDNGPPDPTLSDFVRDWNQKHAYPRLVIATTSEMFHDFAQAYGDKIPSAKGDMTPYWEDGAASSAAETVLNRAHADRLTSLATLYGMMGVPMPHEAFDEAWRNVLLYDEHTWGAYNSISEPDSPFVAAQWAIKKAFATSGGGILPPWGEPARLPSVDDSIAVVNPRSWASTGLMGTYAKDRSPRKVVCSGTEVPSQLMGTNRVFLASSIPAFGAKVFEARPGQARPFEGVSAEGTTLRGPDLTVVVDPKTGAISSLRSRKLGQDLANPDVGVNAYLYLPGSDLRALKPSGPAKVTVADRGPLVATLRIESPASGCRKLTREVSLVYGLDSVRVFDTLDKLPVREKEGVHLAFGFNVPRAQVRMEIPWGVERPEIDQLPGSCKNWFTVQRWIDVSNGEIGVTIATPDTPLWEVGAITAYLVGSQTNPNAWIQKSRSAPVLFSWVMNNHWHTNYRAEQEGPTTFRYWLRPHGRFDSAAATRFGIEVAQPMWVTPPSVAAGLAQPVLTLSPGPVIVSSLTSSRDGKAVMVRLFNPTDKAATTTLRWAARTRLFQSSPSEERGAALEGPISLPPWGVATLRAERG